MDLALTEEESLLQSSARRLLSSECPPALAREYRSRAGAEYPRELWSRLAELGWLSLTPEAGLQAAGVLLEELGAAAAPLPYLEAAVLAPALLRKLGSYEDHGVSMEGGQRIVVPAFKEPGRSWFAAPHSRLSQPGSAWGEPAGRPAVGGEKDMTAWAGAAGALLWPARRESPPTDGAQQVEWLLIEAGDDGLRRDRLETEADENVYRLRASGVSRFTSAGSAAGSLEYALAVAAVAQAAEITGICRAITTRTVEYAKDRRQFGVAIGSFQAVQHRCVEMATDLEGMRLLARQAAWRLDQGLPAQPQASLAKAFASEAGRRTIYNGHQVHGAVGFIREHDLHLYTSRLRVLEARYGDAAFHRARAAGAFVDGALVDRDPAQACTV